MKPALGWIHIKDLLHPLNDSGIASMNEEPPMNFVPAGSGDSGYRRILEDLRVFLPELEARMLRRGVEGVFADLEPHLKSGGQFGGYSGADGFGVAVRAFCRLCDETGIDYRLRDFADFQ
jgi:hypothetical protein